MEWIQSETKLLLYGTKASELIELSRMVKILLNIDEPKKYEK